MAGKRATGVLMVWADLPADKEDEFGRWWNEEHLSELLAVPGFLNGARYEAVSGSPKHMVRYELESPTVLDSPAFKSILENRSELSSRINLSASANTLVANVYQQIFPQGGSEAEAQDNQAPALQTGRMDIPPEIEDEFNHWYNTIYVPCYEKVPGCRRARRYQAVRGAPKYAVVYELEHEKVPQSPEWAVARESHPQSARIRPQMKHAPGSPGIYKKVFPL